MVIALATKPGINGANTLSIPEDWDATWFRKFIANSLKGADVRNAIGANGITVTGSIASPYATISIGPGPIVLQPTAGQTTLTVNGAANSSTVLIQGSTTTGQSLGLDVRAGTNASDRTAIFRNATASATYLSLNGDGSFTLGFNGVTSNISGSANGSVTISQPQGAATAFSVTSVVGGRAVSANVGATSSGGVAYTATDSGSTANVLLATQTANYSSTGAVAPVLTANKPGASTSILGWFRVTLNGTSGWIPVWNN